MISKGQPGQEAEKFFKDIWNWKDPNEDKKIPKAPVIGIQINRPQRNPTSSIKRPMGECDVRNCSLAFPYNLEVRNLRMKIEEEKNMARVQYREKNITTMSCPRCEKNLSIVKIRQDKTTQTPKQGLCTRTLTRHFLNSCASPGTYLGAINFVKMFQRHQYFQQRASNAYQPTAAVIPTCSTVSGARAVAGSNNLHAQNNGLASNMEVEGCEPNPIRNNLHTLSPALQNQHPPPYRWLTRQ
mmetsp:Transcript_21348/g.34429  ORF Transcript_21348/g.34429 Transcript_21348/m.34429 type:complete len:241 (-) Transcript_21348:3595-4317(-)